MENLARTDMASRQLLIETGGRWEWAPIAAAMRRRLPRRMAARFLPEVERVTVAVSGTEQPRADAAANAAAAASAMASLLLVGCELPAGKLVLDSDCASRASNVPCLGTVFEHLVAEIYVV